MCSEDQLLRLPSKIRLSKAKRSNDWFQLFSDPCGSQKHSTKVSTAKDSFQFPTFWWLSPNRFDELLLFTCIQPSSWMTERFCSRYIPAASEAVAGDVRSNQCASFFWQSSTFRFIFSIPHIIITWPFSRFIWSAAYFYLTTFNCFLLLTNGVVWSWRIAKDKWRLRELLDALATTCNHVEPVVYV